MIGNNIVYEPSFENKELQKNVSRLGIDEKSSVGIEAAFGNTDIKNMK